MSEVFEFKYSIWTRFFRLLNGCKRSMQRQFASFKFNFFFFIFLVFFALGPVPTDIIQMHEASTNFKQKTMNEKKNYFPTAFNIQLDSVVCSKCENLFDFQDEKRKEIYFTRQFMLGWAKTFFLFIIFSLGFLNRNAAPEQKLFEKSECVRQIALRHTIMSRLIKYTCCIWQHPTTRYRIELTLSSFLYTKVYWIWRDERCVLLTFFNNIQRIRK